MAELVTGLQRIKTGVTRAKVFYNRVVSCGAVCKDPAHNGFGFTESLGTRLWLLDVRVRFNPHVWTALHSVNFYILHGSGIPKSGADILRWKKVLPITMWGTEAMAWIRSQIFDDMDWQMEQLFEGENNRFGVWFEVSPDMPVMELRCSFRISEG